jgi:nucleoside-diphosphate-sugar epimerase
MTDSIHEEKKQIRINKRIIDNILKILQKIKIKNLVYFNSSSVYSSFNKKPLNENQKLKPSIALGKSKFYGENKLSQYCKIKKIKFLSLRIFTVYGPKMSEHQFIPQAIKKFYLKKKKIIFWNKETKRSFIYIDDLIKIIEKLTFKFTKNRLIINIGGLKLYKVEDVINIIAKITKIKKKITYLNSKNNFDHIVDFSKFKKTIKQFKFTPLEKGLIKTINDF